MDTKELLQAIGQMMDEKLESTKIELRQEMSDFREEMTRQNNETRVLVENKYQRIENLLREEYGRVAGNAAKGAEAADSCKELRSIQTDHAVAIRNHHERITVLEEKAI